MTELQWNRDRLYRLVKDKLGESLFIVVANREPYVHSFSGEEIICNRPVGGLTEALDPVLRAAGGTWVAQAAGDADRAAADADGRVAVPPDAPEYTLRRVWLTDEEVKGYYLGFANQGLWPLCHVAFTPPEFNEADWETYKRVNHIFADAVLQEIGSRKAVVLVQDYHFALLSGYLKERNPQLTVGQFWHIPWPPWEQLRTCPWHREILNGLLGNDLLGFHTPSFCDNFMESVERADVARPDSDTIVEAFPISVDFDNISEQAFAPEVEREMAALRQELNLEGRLLGFGMDRLDYTKGIPERLLALDRFLADNPQHRGKVLFVQAGMPSRTQLDAYRQTGQCIENLIRDINGRYGMADWQPVVPMARQLAPVTVNALRRLARFCIVSSLHDGMNLVAKEYAAARADGDGVLILSEFTGAADELREAMLINPYDTGAFAVAIKQAVEMPEPERRRRMQDLRDVVAGNNIYRWGGDMVARLISLAGV